MLSAIFFCIVIAVILCKTEDECQSGFSAGGDPSNLSYADISAISDSHQNLQSFIDSLAKHAAEVGLQINISKSECMTTEKTNPVLNLTVHEKPIKHILKFVHRHNLSTDNDGMVAVNHRIGHGWAAFDKNKTALTSKRIPYCIKSSTYNT